MTGELLNISDAYSHPLFYKGVDEATGFVTRYNDSEKLNLHPNYLPCIRNILCIPIKDDNEVVGIAQLCNKINGMQFTPCDEEIAIAFSIFCGISIIHSLMYKKVQDAQSRSKLSNELMMYHMKVSKVRIVDYLNFIFLLLVQVSPEDLARLVEAPLPVLDEQFSSFSFIPRSIPFEDSSVYTLAMFEDLGLAQRLRVGREVLAK